MISMVHCSKVDTRRFYHRLTGRIAIFHVFLRLAAPAPVALALALRVHQRAELNQGVKSTVDR